MDIKEFEVYIKELPIKLNKAVVQSLHQAAQETESRLSRLFKTEGRSEGVEWAPLKEAYLKWKIKKGFSEKKLHKTATLAQSFNSIVNETSAVVGTPVPYSVYHEFGTRKMPARPFMEPVFNTMVKRLEDIFKKNLAEVL
jgi:HK97 gp10 family phage protein